jgi:nicotinamidase-related amidase
MPTKNRDLHGNTPDKSEVALIMIDVINDFDFPEAELLLQYAMPMAKCLKELKRRAKAAGVPAIYVNDNFGRWRSDFKHLVDHCLRADGRGRELVDLLKPDEDDYFVLKPKHSAFFSTSLDLLLKYLEVKSLILTGLASDICVLFTANDAYMRDYHLFVPDDCVAANTAQANEYALRQIRGILKADTTPSDQLKFSEITALSK